MVQDRLPYLSYMLRLWLEDDSDRGCANWAEGEWRASLQDPHTQEMQVFTDMKALFAFLVAETARRASGEDARPQEGG